MAVVAAFHSIRETEKPDAARRHHNTDTCELGRNIPEDERRARVQATTNCARTARKPRRDVRGTRSLTRALTDGGLV